MNGAVLTCGVPKAGVVYELPPVLAMAARMPAVTSSTNRPIAAQPMTSPVMAMPLPRSPVYRICRRAL